MPTNGGVMEDFEGEANRQGYRVVVGVDEAGRGPLAGPVVAGAIVLPPGFDLPGLDDSKKLSPEKRESFYDRLVQSVEHWAVAEVDVETIDHINILQATRLAMKQAVEKLSCSPDLVLIDGNQRIDITIEQKTLVGGDGRCRSIAAASILAKVSRDRTMLALHQHYPQYGFDQHKGYGTKLHRERIRELGPSPHHRVSFKGVKEFV